MPAGGFCPDSYRGCFKRQETWDWKVLCTCRLESLRYLEDAAMNRKQFIILLVLVAVIGAAGFQVRQRGEHSWQASNQSLGRKLLPDLPLNDVAQITIKAGTGELNLAKRDNLWRVSERRDYPANFSQISGLLLKFADLKISQAEEIGPSQLGRFELLPPDAGTNTATQVEFKDAAGKTREVVLLGKKHMKKPAANSTFGGMNDEGWPDGRYVMAGTSAKTIALVSDALEDVQPKPESWLNKDFFSIEKPRSIAVQFPEATNSWELTRASETNDWQLADAAKNEKPDATKVSSVTKPFSSPSFNDVAPAGDKPENSGLTNLTIVTVDTFDGFTYTVKLGEERNGDFPMRIAVTANLPVTRVAAKDERPEDKTKLDAEFKDRQKKLSEKLASEKKFEGWVYFVPSYNVEPVIKLRSQLLTEPPSEQTAKAGNKAS
jgi:hypothetical protein